MQRVSTSPRSFTGLLFIGLWSLFLGIGLGIGLGRLEAAPSKHQLNCIEALRALTSSQQARNVSPQAIPPPTLIEAELTKFTIFRERQAQLDHFLQQLQELDAPLAEQARKALRKHQSYGVTSLRLDLSNLPSKMRNFVEGPFEKITGARGVSEPFMSIKALSENQLMIHHYGDRFPLLIEWAPVSEPVVMMRTMPKKGPKVRALQIPESMTGSQDLKLLESEVWNLLSASGAHPYIDASRSADTAVAALLHNGRLLNPRPTQVEYNRLRQTIDTHPELRAKVDSLLYVAPTAAGKTRILGNNIATKIVRSHELGHLGPQAKKLNVVMAHSPDLVNQLALDIGRQLRQDLPANRPFRTIQWSGQESENMKIAELIHFVESSDSPVVFVTSSQTLASRVKDDADLLRLFRLATSLNLDEAHNSGGQTFRRVMDVGLAVAGEDRAAGAESLSTALDILGTTASPLSRTERTVEVFHHTFWASIDSPGRFAQRTLRNSGTGTHNPSVSVQEWVRIQQQYNNARLRGEISAPPAPLYFNPRESGFQFDSLFHRKSSGTHWYVNIDRLKQIWPTLSEMIADHGPGVINAHPRDAKAIADLLSGLTGKNYVSLTGLSAAQRDAVHKAFQARIPYKGKPVDAIVGKIREGLDFPEAGWYFSFKKYIRFPESLQAQGRVVRLARDKPTPVIVYFGEDLESVAFREVRELVLRKMGKLPRRMAEGRGFIASRLPRNSHPDSRLGGLMGELNVAMEALFRSHPDLAQHYAQELERPSADVLEALRRLLLRNRSSQANREMSMALKDFIYEINAFSFYQGSLDETWKFADKLLAAARRGPPYPTRMTPAELAILGDSAQMARVAEFRAMRNWMGAIPRSVLADAELRPNNIYEVADSLSAFVALNGRAPMEGDFLKADLDRAMSTSAETLWNRLSYKSRVILDSMFEDSHRSFEDSLQHDYRQNSNLPDFLFAKLGLNQELSLHDKVSHRLAQRLQAQIHSGTLNLKRLDPQLLRSLDESDFFARTVGHVGRAIADLQSELSRSTGEVNRVLALSYDELAGYDSFGALRVVRELAESHHPRSREYYTWIQELLEGTPPEIQRM